MDILDVITDYFGVGGLFNPELMEHDKVSNMVEMARAEITSLRAELEKAKKDGWISVKDRMPENVHIEHLTVGHSKAVLGYVKDNLCTFCVSYDYEHKAWRYFCDSNHIVRHEITHWQPLPKIPAESF